MRESRKASGSNVGAARRGCSWESGWREGRSSEHTGEEEEEEGDGGEDSRGEEGSSMRDVCNGGRRRVNAGNQNNQRKPVSRQSYLRLRLLRVQSNEYSFPWYSDYSDTILLRQRLHGNQDGNHTQTKPKIKNQKSPDITNSRDL